MDYLITYLVYSIIAFIKNQPYLTITLVDITWIYRFFVFIFPEVFITLCILFYSHITPVDNVDNFVNNFKILHYFIKVIHNFIKILCKFYFIYFYVIHYSIKRTPLYKKSKIWYISITHNLLM